MSLRTINLRNRFNKLEQLAKEKRDKGTYVLHIDKGFPYRTVEEWQKANAKMLRGYSTLLVDDIPIMMRVVEATCGEYHNGLAANAKAREAYNACQNAVLAEIENMDYTQMNKKIKELEG